MLHCHLSKEQEPFIMFRNRKGCFFNEIGMNKFTIYDMNQKGCSHKRKIALRVKKMVSFFPNIFFFAFSSILSGYQQHLHKFKSETVCNNNNSKRKRHIFTLRQGCPKCFTYIHSFKIRILIKKCHSKYHLVYKLFRKNPSSSWPNLRKTERL